MSTTNQSNIVPKKLLVTGASGLLGVAGQRSRAANKAIREFGITVPLAIAMTVPNSAGSMWRSSAGLGSNLRGKTLAVVGLGNIGKEVARIGLAFGMKLIAWSQNLTEPRSHQGNLDDPAVGGGRQSVVNAEITFRTPSLEGCDIASAWPGLHLGVDLSQTLRQLASASRKKVITPLEREDGEGPNVSDEVRLAVQSALEMAGVEFIPENGGGAGVRLAKRRKRRSRCRCASVALIDARGWRFSSQLT